MTEPDRDLLRFAEPGLYREFRNYPAHPEDMLRVGWIRRHLEQRRENHYNNLCYTVAYVMRNV